MQNNAFTPFGQAVAVDSSAAVQVVTNCGLSPTSYRIRNTGSAGYIGYSVNSTVNTTAPTVGTAQTNVIGMIGTSVEVFCLPPNAYFKASSGATFEVTPGEGV